AAERIEREVVEEELRTVLEEQRHAMAVAIAGPRVRVLELQNGVARSTVGEFDAVGMVGAAGRRGRAEEHVVGRRARGRHEGVEDGRGHGAQEYRATAEVSRSRRPSTAGASGYIRSLSRSAWAHRSRYQVGTRAPIAPQASASLTMTGAHFGTKH